MELAPREWAISRDEPNVLVLDRAAWTLGEGSRHEPDFILRIDDAVRRALQVPVRGGTDGPAVGEEAGSCRTCAT